jgi:uncharacterized protein GlcG (DUF336 family)
MNPIIRLPWSRQYPALPRKTMQQPLSAPAPETQTERRRGPTSAISFGLALSAAACAQNAAQPTPVPAPAAVAAAASAPAQPPARGPSLELALEAARVALQTCTERQQKIGVSVIDAGGALKVVLAADGVSPRGVASSGSKAQTALSFKAATSVLAEQAKTDKALADRLAAGGTTYNARAGAVLLQVGNEVIGAIGVGGARGSEVDEACAVAGLNTIRSRLQ